jgi:hypothetical protein
LPEAHLSVAEKQAYAPPATPELDESIWLAWKEKNRAKDRVRAVRRRRILLLLLVVSAATVILVRVTG